SVMASVGEQAARRGHPGVVYGSPTYEKTSGKRFFKTIREDPWLFVRVTAQKAVVIAFYGGVALAWLALLLPTILTFGPMRRRMRRYLLLAAPALALSWIPPLVAV